MAVLDRIFERLGWSGPLRREDRPLWAAAGSIDDLAELTAQWLEGRIASQPGYYGPVDVDEDDAPGLTDTLIALNRAGFLTNCSQAGFDGAGYDGAHWQQLAAVEGFIAGDELVDQLRAALDGTRFQFTAYAAWKRRPGVPVTTREGRPVTRFGHRLSARTIAGELYAGCSAEALDAVCTAWQVTIWDPEPGANDLWPVLRAAAELATVDLDVPAGPLTEHVDHPVTGVRAAE